MPRWLLLLRFTVAFAFLENLEFVWSVDHRLHAQYATVFVIHFDPVVLEPVFYTGSGGSLAAVRGLVCPEPVVELFAEEAEDVRCAQPNNRMIEQFSIWLVQS